MYMFFSSKACSALSAIALINFLAFSSNSIGSTEISSSTELTTENPDCKKTVSVDENSIVVENCDSADIDLISKDGSRIRIKSKGKSNSINIRINK